MKGLNLVGGGKCGDKRYRKRMKILARHKWVAGAVITESVDKEREGYKDISFRRFTATIEGFRNWKIYEGYLNENTAEKVKEMVKYIQNRIKNGNEEIFKFKGYFIKGRDENGQEILL